MIQYAVFWRKHPIKLERIGTRKCWGVSSFDAPTLYPTAKAADDAAWEFGVTDYDVQPYPITPLPPLPPVEINPANPAKNNP